MKYDNHYTFIHLLRIIYIYIYIMGTQFCLDNFVEVGESWYGMKSDKSWKPTWRQSASLVIKDGRTSQRGSCILPRCHEIMFVVSERFVQIIFMLSSKPTQPRFRFLPMNSQTLVLSCSPCSPAHRPGALFRIADHSLVIIGDDYGKLWKGLNMTMSMTLIVLLLLMMHRDAGDGAQA